MHIIIRILFIIVVLELFVLLYFLFNKREKRENKIMILFCIIILLLSVLICYFKIDLFDKKIVIKDLSLLFIAIFISIVLKCVHINRLSEEKCSRLLKTISEYEKIIDEQGEKNHEYNNQLMILKGYINNKEKLSEYLESIISDHKTGQNFEIRQLSQFPNDGLKEMLYYKIGKIKDNNIKYYLYVSSEACNMLEKLKINLYKDITKVFGVLIDNAIDASLKSEEKEVAIDFSDEEGQIIITISNTYNKNVDIKRIGKKGYSTKGRGHGFGLKLVKDILKRNKYLELVTDNDEKYFNQTLIIYSK